MYIINWLFQEEAAGVATVPCRNTAYQSPQFKASPWETSDLRRGTEIVPAKDPTPE
jgi:hypothetical protein